MTHLGLNSLVATAERGHTCLGVSQDAALIQELQQNPALLRISEPELPEMLQRNKLAGRINFSSDFSTLKNYDVVYIAADVPTNDNAESDLRPIYQLIENVIPNLSATATLVILCQVPPGFTRELADKFQFSASRLAYQVETLVFGQAIARALHPERFIIGCNDSKNLPQPYAALLSSFNCPILPMRYESAELAKIAINCCLVAAVSTANTLAELCEGINADWREIVPALKLDKRIGAHAYLAPGLGIAGGNLERDLRTVINLAQTHGSDASVVKSWVSNSAHRKNWAFRTLHKEVLAAVSATAKLAVLGLAYKENTDSIKNSPAVALLQQILAFDITAFDPAVPTAALPAAVGQKIKRAATLDAALVKDLDAILIMTPWPEFRELTAAKMRELASHKTVIIDPYNLLNANEFKAAGFRYLTLGVSTC
jgi:UDPglucose 6-dehydrogenase